MATVTTAARTGTVTTWQLDPGRSRVSFAVRKRLLFVRHLTVVGRVADIAGTISLDEARPTHSSVSATIPVATVDTGNARRDKHLRDAAFFDAERFPTIAFQSRAVTPIDAPRGHYRIAGDLTVRGVTRRVDLDTHLDAAQASAAGRLRFTATTNLDRRDFGLVWDSPFIKVFDAVAVTLEIDAVPDEHGPPGAAAGGP